MAYQAIEDYGVIGDLHTVALVGLDGSIDFLCFPHFDSPSIFAALLDDDDGGRFRIAPRLADPRCEQLYLPDTNVLLTRFLSEDGVAEISDFMPIVDGTGDEHAHRIVRRVKAVRGRTRFRMICDPRFDYGRRGHRIEPCRDGVRFLPEGNDLPPLRLETPVELDLRDGPVVAEFELAAGEAVHFVLGDERRDDGAWGPEFVSDAFKSTVNFWRRWVGRSRYSGRWREIVNRSALVLKLLSHRPTGAVVAAPTFSLPEEIGGERNWDYRYTWIRDASFTLDALMRLGYAEEAGAFMFWLEDRCLGCDVDDDESPLQIMYGLDGRRRLAESRLSHFEGYRGSAPVRIGNAAHDQLQLDVFGELLEAVDVYDANFERIHHELWNALRPVVDWVTRNWERADEGIWEVRGGRRHFLFSRLMCWVALDRAIRLARRRSFPAPLERWEGARDEIYRDVFSDFWNEEKGAFVQHRGTRALDASSLMMPLVDFISPTDPMWLSTLRAIEEELVDDSLVYRYLPEDMEVEELEGGEGTFSICSFWYVECLARAGDLPQARFVFEKALGYANHLGLYSEQLGPRGEHLGNFPQAFTHLALIRTACELDRRLAATGGPR